jgi:hypothetical protein
MLVTSLRMTDSEPVLGLLAMDGMSRVGRERVAMDVKVVEQLGNLQS